MEDMDQLQRQLIDISAELANAEEAQQPLVDALKWYATATYPDDGSGRPPEAFQRRAKAALAKVK
jgi:hypothetical protein